MNVKRLKLGFIIGLAGIVGATTFGVISMPYAIETNTNAYEKAQEILVENTIDLSEYKEINKLVVNGEHQSFTINKSNTGYNYIEYRGTKRYPINIDIEFNDKEKELKLDIKTKLQDEEKRFKKGMSLKNFIDEFLIKEYENNFIWNDSVGIYLTDAVDVEINNISNGLDISDASILKDELVFNNIYSTDFYLPENHNLKRLIVNSEGHVDLNSEDLRGIEEIQVNANEFVLSNQDYSKNIEKSEVPAKNILINAKDITLNFNDKLAEKIEISGARDIAIYGNSYIYPYIINSKNIRYYENMDDMYNGIYDEEGNNNIELDNLFIGRGNSNTATKVNIKTNIERLMIE